MATLDIIEQIEQDFTEQREPFDDVEFPEERLLHRVSVVAGNTDETISLSMEEKLQLVSMFATFDYNRDANQLVDKILELHKRNANWFDAWHVPNSEAEVEQVFSEIGFRYPSRDARAWVKNCRILRQEFHGKWSELLLSVGCDAPRLVEQVNESDFNCVKGVKIAPMYCRIINDEVTELRNLWELDIPIDTHLRRLSKDLFDTPDASDDELRDMWQFYGLQNDISRHVVDAALWQVGNQWDQWGEEYWESLGE
jgi:hypothetical protein